MLGKLEDFLVEHTSKMMLLLQHSEDIGKKVGIKTTEINELQKVIGKILNNPESSSELFKPSFRPALGQLLTILLDNFVDSKVDAEIRLKCALLLCSLTDERHKQASAEFVAFILPGVFAACQKVLLGDFREIKSLEIAKNAGQLLRNALTVAFSTNAGTKGEESQLQVPNDEWKVVIAFKRDENWTRMARENVSKQLAMMFSRMCVHEVGLIRLEVLKIVSVLYDQQLLGDQFDQAAFDVVCLLLNDEKPGVKDACEQLAAKFRLNDNLIGTYALQKLKRALKTLEKDVKNASSGHNHFTNFVNLVELIDPKLLGRLFEVEAFLERFISPILAIIAVDRPKMCSLVVCQEEIEENDILLLKYGLKENQLSRLAQILVRLSNFQSLFHWLLDQFDMASMPRRTAIVCLSSSMAVALSKGSQNDENYGKNMAKLFESQLDMLKSLAPWLDRQVWDHQVEDVLPEETDELCLAQLLLISIAQLNAKALLDANATQKVAREALYEVLKLCASQNAKIGAAADACLSSFSKNAQPNSPNPQSDFLLANAHWLVFKLSLDARDFSSHNPHFPPVLAELVTRCSANPEMYKLCRKAVDELLFWLDHSDQGRTLLLLRALRAFARAMLAWFPELVPTTSSASAEEEEEEDEAVNRRKKDVNYPLISTAVTILNRTKHFISSTCLPIQLLILDILHCSMEFVRNYEDQLLPAIHQNWHGLVHKLDHDRPQQVLLESQKLVAAKAVCVVELISRLSGQFVHWKVLRDFLPRAVALLNTLSSETPANNMGKLYRHSASFQLQFALIESMPTIMEKSGATAVHTDQEEAKVVHLLHQALALYANGDGICEELRRMASEALEKIGGNKCIDDVI